MNWISNRAEEFYFKEKQDFIVFNKIIKSPVTNGRPRKEYLLTLDTAKELCMMQNNDKGKRGTAVFYPVQIDSLRSICTAWPGSLEYPISGMDRLYSLNSLFSQWNIMKWHSPLG